MRHAFSFIILFLIYIAISLTIVGPTAAGDQKKPDKAMAMQEGHAAAGDRVAAKVNDVGITLDMLNKQMRQMSMKKYGREKITPSLAQRIKEEAMDRLITEELAFQKATPLAGEISAGDIDDHMAKLQKEFGGRERFAQYMLRENLTESDIRKQTERFLVVQRFLAKAIYPKAVVTDQEIRELYENSKENFVQQELVQITDIVFFLEPDAPDSRSKAEQVAARLKNELNNDPAGLEPDPTFHVDDDIKVNQENNPGLYEAAKKLKEHEISEVLTVDGTLHIIKLTGYRPRVEKSMEEVLPGLEHTIKNEIKKQLVEEWMADLRKGARIEIFDFSVQ